MMVAWEALVSSTQAKKVEFLEEGLDKGNFRMKMGSRF